MPTKMWTVAALPATKNAIFMLSASHRDDMYHIQTAMIAQTKSERGNVRYLYIHDCPNVPNDLMDYLKAIAQELRMPYCFVSYSHKIPEVSAHTRGHRI